MKKRHALGALAALGTMALPGYALGQSVDIEALLWEPTGQDVVLGSEALVAPFGNDLLDFDMQAGFGISVHGTNWRIVYRDIGFEEDYIADHGGLGNFTVALDHPAGTYGAYDTVAAVGNIDLRLLDADLLIPINTATSTRLTAFTGLRYVDYGSSLRADYDAGGQIVTRSADNSLFGVRVGLEAEQPLFIDNFYLGLHGAISMLMGESEFTHTESASGFQRNLGLDATVPVIEAGLRLNYAVNLAAIRLEMWAGYEFIQFDDIVTAQMFVDNIGSATQFGDGVSAGFRGYTVGFLVNF